jgi:hypothetical protein
VAERQRRRQIASAAEREVQTHLRADLGQHHGIVENINRTYERVNTT